MPINIYKELVTGVTNVYWGCPLTYTGGSLMYTGEFFFFHEEYITKFRLQWYNHEISRIFFKALW